MENALLKTLKYENISIGDTASFKRKIILSDIDLFAKLSGDTNPLHCNEKYAKNTPFKSRIVHGMLASSLFSQLVGIHLPGKYCLYVSQDIQFRNPIFPNTDIIVQGKVKSKMDAFKLLTIETTIFDPISKKVYISGQAKVKVFK